MPVSLSFDALSVRFIHPWLFQLVEADEHGFGCYAEYVDENNVRIVTPVIRHAQQANAVLATLLQIVHVESVGVREK
jgi:hypothetical protein